MILDRTTYEAWLLDRIEGNLTPAQERELDAFLAENPDLGTDITGVQAPLNNTGDYRIVVVSDQGAGPLSYSLTAEIP